MVTDVKQKVTILLVIFQLLYGNFSKYYSYNSMQHYVTFQGIAHKQQQFPNSFILKHLSYAMS